MALSAQKHTTPSHEGLCGMVLSGKPKTGQAVLNTAMFWTAPPADVTH